VTSRGAPLSATESPLRTRYLEPVLKAVGLAKTYRTPSGDIDALRDFDHEFESGRITAVMGPSGSGKTTLLNLLAGLDTPTDGQVTLDGTSIGALSERQRAELRRTSFGIVFQSFNLITVLSARQNVALPMALAGQPFGLRVRRAQELLGRFGLTQRAEQLPHRLSGGERQRVALARALANDPRVLFADEPTGNLDSTAGAVVLGALREIADEGRTVIVVTHDPALSQHADTVLTLRDGRLVMGLDQRAGREDGLEPAFRSGSGSP
jgi:putative ABC transport system ATP-binding protein